MQCIDNEGLRRGQYTEEKTNHWMQQTACIHWSILKNQNININLDLSKLSVGNCKGRQLVAFNVIPIQKDDLLFLQPFCFLESYVLTLFSGFWGTFGAQKAYRQFLLH